MVRIIDKLKIKIQKINNRMVKLKTKMANVIQIK